MTKQRLSLLTPGLKDLKDKMLACPQLLKRVTKSATFPFGFQRDTYLFSCYIRCALGHLCAFIKKRDKRVRLEPRCRLQSKVLKMKVNYVKAQEFHRQKLMKLLVGILNVRSAYIPDC